MVDKKQKKQILRDANDLMQEWNDLLVMEEIEHVPEEVQLYRNKLEAFYKKAGKVVKDPTLFNPRVKLSEELEEELVDLAWGFANATDADSEKYIGLLEDPIYTDLRERQNIKTLDDAITFLDQMESYRQNRINSSVLSSEQVRALYREGLKRGVTNTELDNMIYFEYTSSGMTGDELFDFLWEQLQGYDEKMASFM